MSEEQQQDAQDQREADQHDQSSDEQEQSGAESKDSTLAKISQERREARERARKAEARVQELEAKQREADEAKAKEEGKYKELLEAREKELAEARQKVAERDLRDLRTDIAKEHGLKAEAMEFVTGDDKDAISDSVKKLVKLFASEDGPDTDSGKRSSASKSTSKNESLLASYEFGKRR
jgi:hypothetical protein